ncbi:MAG: leucyl aminopeptidase family protein [Betaproteobacteria bacterium]|nr:leucyl aminopeptidase family protein [Betaproteobacteria bacterium]
MKVNLPKVALLQGTPSLGKIDARHLLIVTQAGVNVGSVFEMQARDAALARGTKKNPAGAKSTPTISSSIGGRLLVWVEWDPATSTFEQQTALRKALDILYKESPSELAILVQAESSRRGQCASQAIYVALVNSQFRLGKTSNQKASGEASLASLQVWGVPKGYSVTRSVALAEGNLLSRALTLRPPNDLTPKRYRADVVRLAKDNGWDIEQYDFKRLRKMGAGAFCAVAQGSPQQDAAIVRLSYRPRKAEKRVLALVGKGICMDTGGHGLKSAKGMYGMHEDMNGSAVVLGILKAVSDLKLPIAIDAWLAIAQNHIGPEAYQPGDIVTALDKTTIEVVHTDAEGRMVLADTLTMAAREKPAVMLDFATLTGAMAYSLDSRMSGVFASTTELAKAASACGEASGERVVLFPLEKDYDEALESKVADIKQCLIAGEGDAIYAARFLARFAKDVPWAHMDLSSYRHEGGLGAVAGDVSGFGVAWGLAMVEAQISK